MSNIRFFRTFLEVTRQGSFSAASEHVSLTPTAVGLQIQALENYLGYPVFDRAGKNISLNERGHRLVPLVTRLIEICEEMKKGESDAEGLTGSLKVASIATSMGLVVKSVLRMRALHPKLSIQPGISYSGDLPARVSDGDLDAAISVKIGHKPPAGVIWTPLYCEPLVFVSNKCLAGTDSIAQILKKHLFLRVSPDSATGVLIDRYMRKKKLKPTMFLEMNAMRTIVDMVREKLGVTILPNYLGADWNDDPQLQIIRLTGGDACRYIGVFENEKRTHLTSALRQQLLTIMKERLESEDHHYDLISS